MSEREHFSLFTVYRRLWIKQTLTDFVPVHGTSTLQTDGRTDRRTDRQLTMAIPPNTVAILSFALCIAL